MTVQEFRKTASARIYASSPEEQKDIETARFIADNLLYHFCGYKKSDILLLKDRELPQVAEALLFDALEKKEKNVPLQYILGKWEFFGLEMYCGEGCLIPRAETEFLCEYAIKHLPENGVFFDLCTGSGCIAASILKNRPDVSGIAVDISEDALSYARRNFSLHGVSDRIKAVLCDISEYSPEICADMIISNPPYIKSSDMEKLSEEVKKEPSIALDGGPDGLLFYRILAGKWGKALRPDGAFVLEAGFDTTEKAAGIFALAGYETKIINDYSDIPRSFIAKKGEII